MPEEYILKILRIINDEVSEKHKKVKTLITQVVERINTPGDIREVKTLLFQLIDELQEIDFKDKENLLKELGNQIRFLEEKQREIDKIIGDVSSIALRTPYIESLSDTVLDERLPTEIDKKIKQVIAGHILIDLGCGDLAMLNFNEVDWNNIDSRRFGPMLAKYWGAAGYIGVDPYNLPEDLDTASKEEIEDYEKNLFDVTGMKISYKREDMLKFVSRQPDNSYCYLVSGIDDEIIEYDWEKGGESYKKYQNRLMQELYRTTSTPGVVIVHGGTISIIGGLMEELGFKHMRARTGMTMTTTFWIKE